MGFWCVGRLALLSLVVFGVFGGCCVVWGGGGVGGGWVCDCGWVFVCVFACVCECVCVCVLLCVPERVHVFLWVRAGVSGILCSYVSFVDGELQEGTACVRRLQVYGRSG